MNTDKNLSSQQNLYYPIGESKQYQKQIDITKKTYPLHYDQHKIESEQKNINQNNGMQPPYYIQSNQQIYKNFRNNEYLNQFNNNNNMNYQPPQFINQIQGYQPPIFPISQPPYNPQQTLPLYHYIKPAPTHKITIKKDSYDIVCEAQMASCQKCGLGKTVGPIKFISGDVACAWGACLFFFTGIFFWVPFTINRCKDIHVECPRCGYKKAILNPKCFC